MSGRNRPWSRCSLRLNPLATAKIVNAHGKVSDLSVLARVARGGPQLVGKSEMRKIVGGAVALIAATFVASSAGASTVVVTSSNMMGWSNPPGENGNGTGSATITGDSARSGNGSLELHGDRTRFVLGDLNSSASNLGAFSTFTDLAFEYQIDAASTNACCDPMYSPALRMVVWDGATKYDFVWEQAYQAGGYGAAQPKGSWNTIGSGGTFFRNGTSELDQRTLTSWAGTLSQNAYVGAVYIGVGSGIGAGYTAYADNVTAGGTTYNFEAVPEPATWGLMIMGFGAAGSVLRRRKALAA